MPKRKPNRRYTPEFKIRVIETMHREKLSYHEAARQFNIPDHHSVAAWERIYLEEGAEGLRIERRGLKSTGRTPKPEKKAEKTVWRCTVCGYVYEGEELPADFVCPLCKHPASDFEKVSG